MAIPGMIMFLFLMAIAVLITGVFLIRGWKKYVLRGEPGKVKYAAGSVVLLSICAGMGLLLLHGFTWNRIASASQVPGVYERKGIGITRIVVINPDGTFQTSETRRWGKNMSLSGTWLFHQSTGRLILSDSHNKMRETYYVYKPIEPWSVTIGPRDEDPLLYKVRRTAE
ncbi:MAG: hypothetical protein ACM3QZ_04145 [Solirubrobacterales bacterium]